MASIKLHASGLVAYDIADGGSENHGQKGEVALDVRVCVQKYIEQLTDTQQPAGQSQRLESRDLIVKVQHRNVHDASRPVRCCKLRLLLPF